MTLLWRAVAMRFDGPELPFLAPTGRPGAVDPAPAGHPPRSRAARPRGDGRVHHAVQRPPRGRRRQRAAARRGGARASGWSPAGSSAPPRPSCSCSRPRWPWSPGWTALGECANLAAVAAFLVVVPPGPDAHGAAHPSRAAAAMGAAVAAPRRGHRPDRAGLLREADEPRHGDRHPRALPGPRRLRAGRHQRLARDLRGHRRRDRAALRPARDLRGVPAGRGARRDGAVQRHPAALRADRDGRATCPCTACSWRCSSTGRRRRPPVRSGGCRASGVGAVAAAASPA